jgi:hypothetical protein
MKKSSVLAIGCGGAGNRLLNEFLDYGCFLSSDSIDGLKLPFNMSFIIEAGLVNDFNFRYIDISSSLLALNSIGIINLFGIYFLLFTT